MTAKLRESAALGAKGAKRRIRLISEGQGSSGYYDAKVLERDGATAFPVGTHIYLDHLTESESYDRGGSHSILDLVGVTLEAATFEDGALFAPANFFSNFAPLVEEMAEFIDLSIEAYGVIEEGVVEALNPHPMNAVSIVPRGGRDGKILGLIESYRSGSGKISESSISDNVKEDKPMDEKDITALAEKLAAALAPSFTALTEALKPVVPAEPVIDEDKTEGPSAAEVAEAVVVAFPTSEDSRKRVYEALKNGKTVDEAIADEKALVTSVTESLKTQYADSGFTIRESGSNDFNPRVGGWN